MDSCLADVKKVHLVGIGGVGMTALAFLLRDKGFIVSGSDVKESYNTGLLKRESFEVCIGHRVNNVYGADVVCYSSAVKGSNIELREAEKRNIKILRRAQLLALLSKGAKNIVISGSHGKTTTSAFCAFVLTELGYNPNVFIGAVALNFGKYSWPGKDLFVFEADESDGSFLSFEPWIVIITNIDREHLDFYGNFDNLCSSFERFADKAFSSVIGCGDDKNVKAILGRRKSVSYGVNKDNYVRAENIRFYNGYTAFDLIIGKDKFRDIKISLFGVHNVLNALAVISLCVYLGEGPDKFLPLLRKFKGTRRRFQFEGKVKDITFVNDYAHHPTEIEATLKAAKALSFRRMVVIFQPHRYSRVKLLYRDFAECFGQCDYLVVTDIYPAGESPVEGVDGYFLYDNIRRKFSGSIAYIAKERLVYEVTGLLKGGDLVIGLGAGDINAAIQGIMNEIKYGRSFPEILSRPAQ